MSEEVVKLPLALVWLGHEWNSSPLYAGHSPSAGEGGKRDPPQAMGSSSSAMQFSYCIASLIATTTLLDEFPLVKSIGWRKAKRTMRRQRQAQQGTSHLPGWEGRRGHCECTPIDQLRRVGGNLDLPHADVGEGGANPSTIHTMLERPIEYVNARWIDEEFACIPKWHQMDHVSWSLGLFSKNHLLEVDLTQNRERGTINVHNCWFILFYHVCGPTWMKIIEIALVEDPVIYDFTLHLRIRDHTTWS